MNHTIRIATTAVPLSGNKGSASMLLGLLDSYARAGIDAHFSVFSYYPARDLEVAEYLENVSVHPGHPIDITLKLLPAILLYGIHPCLVPRSWRNHIDALKHVDVVLLMGGTTFTDSMNYKVPWNVLAALPGYLLRRPTVFLSQTIGPLHQSINRCAARWTLKRAMHVHGRGKTSLKCVQDIGIQRCSYWPDLSFSMKVPDFEEVAGRVEIVKKLRDALLRRRRQPIGIAPNTIVLSKYQRAGKDYVDFLMRVVKGIYQKGYLPVIIPHSYRAQSGGMHNNDRLLCQAVLERLTPDIGYFYVDSDLSSRDLRAVIGRMEILVASRFHAMISALSMGVPPITYGWGDHKYLEVLEEFGVPELYVTGDDLTFERFETVFELVLQQRGQLSDQIQTSLREAVEKSDMIPQEIAKILSSHM